MKNYFQIQFTANNDDEKFAILVKVNTKCEWIWRVYLKFFVTYLIGMIMQSTIPALIYWIRNKDFDPQHVYHAFRIMSVKTSGRKRT